MTHPLFTTPSPIEARPNISSPNMLSSLIQPNKNRLGLATLGGFNPPEVVNIANNWKLIRKGGKKEPHIFPPPINDIKWQGFYTKEVNGYGRKLYWVSGYGILPETPNKALMILCQWWHLEPINITDYRMLSSEDWDNANIYIASVDRLEDVFINTQLALFNGTSNQTINTPTKEWVDVIELNPEEPKKEEENEGTIEPSNA